MHTVYTRRLMLISRYRAQCLRMLRLYHLDLRAGIDAKHAGPASGAPDAGPFVTVKRRTSSKTYDLLDAYRAECWQRKRRAAVNKQK